MFVEGHSIINVCPGKQNGLINHVHVCSYMNTAPAKTEWMFMFHCARSTS